MHTNVNLAVPLGILILMGTGFSFFIAFLIFLYTIFTENLGRRNFITGNGRGLQQFTSG